MLIFGADARPCSCFHNNMLAFRSQIHFHNNNEVVIGNPTRLSSSLSWKLIHIQKWSPTNFERKRIEVSKSRRLMIKAVATIESTSTSRENDFQNALRVVDVDSRSSNGCVIDRQSSSEGSEKVDKREKLRRQRISKANKGKMPWNKGRKHSPETLQRIRERTLLAMQNPEVKLKLVNKGHAQSQETKMKIGASIRLGWEKRREQLMLQDACYHEWQSLIAEASRRGFGDEEELQWNSYELLREQLEVQWLQSVEERTNVPRLKGDRRAPKTAEQRRKISEAISAKWADLEYRGRVCSGMSNVNGVRYSVERKLRRIPSDDTITRKPSSPKEKINETNKHANRKAKSPVQETRLRRNNNPSFKDPLASSKLKMLKNIREQRAAAENQMSITLERAKALIANAEKAAQVVEITAKNSTFAQASLVETRMLINEAIQYIKSIEDSNPDLVSHERNSHSPQNTNHDDKEEADTETTSPKVNGVGSLASKSTEGFNFDLGFLNGSALSSNSCNNDSLGNYRDFSQPDESGEKALSDGGLKEKNGTPTMTKKWHCGRLVEVAQVQ